jgi:hypothetical protein
MTAAVTLPKIGHMHREQPRLSKEGLWGNPERALGKNAGRSWKGVIVTKFGFLNLNLE